MGWLSLKKRRRPQKPSTAPDGEFAQSINRLAEGGYSGPWPHGAVPLTLEVGCRHCDATTTFVRWPPSAVYVAADRAGWREERCPAHA